MGQVSDSILRTLTARLRAHPPFDRLDPNTLSELAAELRVRYLEPPEAVFRIGESPKNEVYLVHKGAVRITRGGELAAMCEAGDLFGVRAHLAARPYVADAVVERDALLYCWPAERFVEWVRTLPVLSSHLAAGFAAEGPLAGAHAESFNLAEDSAPLEPTRNVLTCSPDTTVREAALRMTQRRVGSILVVDPERRPRGIITDVDLRRRIVVDGRAPESTRVEAIMSRPVTTILDAPSRAEATIQMTEAGIHHLVTTADGSTESPVTGVIAQHDVMVASGDHPASIVRELARARTAFDLLGARQRLEIVLERYVESSLSIAFISRIATAVNDRIVRRAVEMALEAQGSAPVAFCWLTLGSHARGEQILRTDQDNALLYEEGDHQDYFVALASRVVDILEEAGFSRCPGEMMASNPRWCGDLQHWRDVFDRWIQVPEPRALMHANIFFDFRAVVGPEWLQDELRTHVKSRIEREGRFLPMLANNALQNPAPLGLFRGFVLERGGEHRNEFDLKARALMPLADAARVSSLELGTREVGTVARLHAAAKAEGALADPCTSAAAAYLTLMEVRARQGFQRRDSGRFLDIAASSTFDRQRLRQSFDALGRMQRLLTVRYQTERIR